MEKGRIMQLGRGDIIMVSNDPKPRNNHEQKGRRPWLVLSVPGLYQVAGFVWAIPFTRTPRNYPMAIDWSSRMPESKIEGTLLCDQLTTFDLRSRHFEFVEHVNVPNEVDRRIMSTLHYI